jgi:phage shock protein PspC (stress-responsive transcriptional regulator)
MYKKLYRSNRDKMLGGVAGGLADYFDMDPTLVRVIFIITLFLGGTGVLAYIILWILVPQEPLVFPQAMNTGAASDQNEQDPASAPPYFPPDPQVKKRNGPAVAGMALIVIGSLFLMDNIFPDFSFEDYWPLILVAIGLGLLMSARKKERIPS